MDSPFIDACRRRDPEYTPVWFMRQAGRYLPSYRKIRGTKSVMEIAKNPELSSKVAVDAARALGTDAAIIFADIMLPLEGLGVKFTIIENVGPVVRNTIRSRDDVDSLSSFDAEVHVPFVLEAIDATITKLDGSIPLIGFSGAPFTLAGYMIEGQPSRELTKTKSFMYENEKAWHSLMGKLTAMVRDYLIAQIRHGVQAVQLFDSWVGVLSPSDYSRYVSQYTRAIFESLPQNVPKIHFCADSGNLIEQFHAAGPDVLSVDWRVPIDAVWDRCREGVAVQGNLDPSLAAVGGNAMVRGVRQVLKGARGHRGHIFSLGHGVLRETEPANLRRIVKMVHQTRRS